MVLFLTTVVDLPADVVRLLQEVTDLPGVVGHLLPDLGCLLADVGLIRREFGTHSCRNISLILIIC
jgi:hypothetical protein